MPSTLSIAEPLTVRALGTVPYPEALELQRELVRARAAGDVSDTLLLLDHPPVFTLGRRRSAEANLLAAGDTPVVSVERGGDVTWNHRVVWGCFYLELQILHTSREMISGFGRYLAYAVLSIPS